MLQRDWDPGIGEVLSDHWDSESRFGDGILHDRNVADGRLDFPSDFRTAGLIEGETMIEIWIWRKQGSMKFGSLIFISIIFKTKLNQGRESTFGKWGGGEERRRSSQTSEDISGPL